MRGCRSHPGHVFSGQVYWTPKGARPLHMGRVIMRVTDDDSLDTAERCNTSYCFRVQKRDTVPKDIARGGAQHDGALADGKLGYCGDGDEASVRLVGRKYVMVLARKGIMGGKSLAGGWNELPGIVADEARSQEGGI